MPTCRCRTLLPHAAAVIFTAILPLTASFAQTSEPVKEYDVKAEALLQKAADRLKAAQTYSGQVQVITKIPAFGTNPAREVRTVSTFRLQKPNLVFQEAANQIKGSDGKWKTTPTLRYLSDGKTGAVLALKSKKYLSLKTTPDAIILSYRLNFPEFFTSKRSDAEDIRQMKTRGTLASLRMAPDAVFGGVACSVVQLKAVLGKNQKGVKAYRTTKIYVGKDGLIRGYHIETPSQSGDGTVQIADNIVTGVVVGEPIPVSVFAVSLLGYNPYIAPKAAGRPALLAAGTMAPNFTAYDKNNRPVKLSDYRGKVVVLDFWASWCGPCKASMPHNQAVAQKLQKQGVPVVLLAVDNSEERPAFLQWVSQHQAELSMLVFAHADRKISPIAGGQYHVSGIPTQYILDKSGKITASFVGFGGPTNALENAIKKANTGGAALVTRQ